jgi:hypothetical protein
MLMILLKNLDEKMKKVLFLMLFLFVLGAAGVKAQVRIGGNSAPNGSAVLDLNATDAATGTKGLALPRVNLTSNTMQITSGVTNLTGMLVYNTTATLGVGVYYWNGSNWMKVLDGSFVEGDAIVGNEVTNATSGGGLTRAGSGTAAAPYTLGIANGGVTAAMIANQAVTLAKIATTAADSGKVLSSNGSSIIALAPGSSIVEAGTVSNGTSSPVSVSWQLVWTGSVALNLSPNTCARYTTTGLNGTEICTSGSQELYVQPVQGAIYVYSLRQAGYVISTTGFRCYRPI